MEFKVLIYQDPSLTEKPEAFPQQQLPHLYMAKIEKHMMKQLPGSNYRDTTANQIQLLFQKQTKQTIIPTPAFIEPPKILEMDKFDLPRIEIKPAELQIDVSQLKINLLPKSEEICNIYKKNGGGALARFSLFNRHPKKTPQELIELLQARAIANPASESASKKTLRELGFEVPLPGLRKF